MTSSRTSRWTLLIVSIGLFMVVLDNLVVNVALPSIHRDLGASIQSLEWTVNAYVLAYAVFLLTGATSAHAQSVADFYRGKTVNVLIGVGVGGEYDLQARLLQLSNTPVFTVQSPVPSYWRLTSLDSYTGSTWTSQGSYKAFHSNLPGTRPLGTRQVQDSAWTMHGPSGSGRWQRMRPGLFRGDAGQQLAQAGAVPGVTLERPVQLIGNAKRFRVHSLYSCAFGAGPV